MNDTLKVVAFLFMAVCIFGGAANLKWIREDTQAMAADIHAMRVFLCGEAK